MRWQLYTRVLGIEWFPFMNYLALFILFAIGADDLFIFCSEWERAKVPHRSLESMFDRGSFLL